MQTRFPALAAIGPVLAGCLVLGACTQTVKSYNVKALNGEVGTEAPMSVKQVSSEQVSQSLTRVADSLREKGEYDTAVSVYERARAADPKNAENSLGLAKALWALGDWEDAGRAFEDAHALDPANRDAKIGIANALIATHRLDEAITQFKSLVGEMPDEPRVYSGLGIAYDLKGDHQEAQLRYGMGLDVVPNDLAIKNNLALSFALAHDYSTAIELLHEMPDNPTTRQTLALVYGLSNKPGEAAKMARMDLDDQAVQNNLAYYAWLRGLDGRDQAEAVLLGTDPTKNLAQADTARDRPARPPAVPPTPVQAKPLPRPDASPKSTLKSVPRVDPVTPASVKNKPTTDPAPVAITASQISRPIADLSKDDLPQVSEIDLGAKSREAASSKSDAKKSGKKNAVLYQAQLASFHTYAETEDVKDKLVKNHGDLFNGFDLVIEQADLGPHKGSYHRLRTAPVADKSGTQALCRALKATGTECYVVKVTDVASSSDQPQG